MKRCAMSYLPVLTIASSSRPLPPAPSPPSPKPNQRLEDERAVITELSRLAFDFDDIEFDDDAVFLRPGLPRDILRKLRRTHWVIQEDLDLHGLTGDEATEATAEFLAECK